MCVSVPCVCVSMAHVSVSAAHVCVSVAYVCVCQRLMCVSVSGLCVQVGHKCHQRTMRCTITDSESLFEFWPMCVSAAHLCVLAVCVYRWVTSVISVQSAVQSLTASPCLSFGLSVFVGVCGPFRVVQWRDIHTYINSTSDCHLERSVHGLVTVSTGTLIAIFSIQSQIYEHKNTYLLYENICSCLTNVYKDIPIFIIRLLIAA